MHWTTGAWWGNAGHSGKRPKSSSRVTKGQFCWSISGAERSCSQSFWSFLMTPRQQLCESNISGTMPKFNNYSYLKRGFESTFWFLFPFWLNSSVNILRPWNIPKHKEERRKMQKGPPGAGPASVSLRRTMDHLWKWRCLFPNAEQSLYWAERLRCAARGSFMEVQQNGL